MILMYHKVDVVTPTQWWVSADAFHRQMADLQAYKVVHLSDYDPADPHQVVISFDGIYSNVATVALPIMKLWGYPFELFVVGDTVGRDNDFDQHVEPPCRFASLDELSRLVDAGGRLQWHTATHARLSGRPAEEMTRELTVSADLKERFPAPNFDWFAYPHGEHDEVLEKEVAKRFKGALSVLKGGTDLNDSFKLNRTTVYETSRFAKSTVSLIIPNYNYGVYVGEAIESALAQTVPPDEILVIDDGSNDISKEVLRDYGERVRIEFNERNLGIVENFRKAIGLTRGSYIAFLGADNRLRCDYVEKCRAALDRNPKAAVAYTDMLLFGPLADQLAKTTRSTLLAHSIGERWPIHVRQFPDPSSDPARQMTKGNFIHGSSMYRRAAYEAVGGYARADRPEDQDLFMRMLEAGWGCVHIAEPLLEYRQHSRAQANTVLGLEMQVRKLRARQDELERTLVWRILGPAARLERSLRKLPRRRTARSKKRKSLKDRLQRKLRKWSGQQTTRASPP
jgi:glycosyltransferase involved in cell wall biosynthesis